MKTNQIISQMINWINIDRTYDLLQSIADTPGPSQVAAWTRGSVIEDFLKEHDLLDKSDVKWDRNYKNTGNGLLRQGDPNKKNVWLFAHWDTISYLIGEKSSKGYNIIPYYHHLMEEEARDGLCLGFDLESKQYKIICRGKVIGGDNPKFIPDGDNKLESGYRVVFDTPIHEIDKDGYYAGQFDDAAGCTAILLAATYLSTFSDINLITCFTDEEEGPVCKGNTAFSRGSSRILPDFSAPDLAIVSDMHSMSSKEIASDYLGKGALLTEYASNTKGAVTPPWLFSSIKHIVKSLNPEIKAIISPSYASRSDCVNVYRKTPNVVLAGVASYNRHYSNGIPVCSIYDVMNLARTISVIVLKYFKDDQLFDANLSYQNQLK